jgi:hypothetical protein
MKEIIQSTLKVSDADIALAIVVALGWTDVRISKYPEGEQWWGRPHNSCFRLQVPDYPNDLNAMHEVENTLDDGVHMEFERNLRRICSGRNYRHVISATAHQRAEAFVLTVCPGKWKLNP